jgi:3-phosphoshikimate 1-carboxyvinyltransferase
MRIRVAPGGALRGAIDPPGDKSVSHRAALVGAIASGRTEITGFLEADDCLATLRAVRALGAGVTRQGPGHYLVEGTGLAGLREPEDVVDCGNSGTTARLLAGVLAGQPFSTVLTGDTSLRSRPMARVAEPLRRMGATILGRRHGRQLPLAISGVRPLAAIRHVSSVASAQVKSAVLLAGLWADGPVTVEEPAPSRDHTERMLAAFGAAIDIDVQRVTVQPGRDLRGIPVAVPGDISSAAFFLVAAAALHGSEVAVRHVGVNPTRTGVLDALSAMGAAIDTDGRTQSAEAGRAAGEPVTTLTARGGKLRAIEIRGPLIPRLIDEVPALAVAACLARGTTRICDAAELRVKESDRIQAIVSQLARMGARIREHADGLEIEGGERLRGATVTSGGDHRMAMALVVAGLAAEGPTVVEDTACISTSFPGFTAALNALAGRPCAVEEP